MKRFFLFSLCILSMILVSACSEEEQSGGFSFDTTENMVLNSEGNAGITIMLSSEENAEATIHFTSNLNWQATVSADWLEISPAEGQGGSNTIYVTALSRNNTNSARTATLTLTSRNVSTKISITQETSNYLHIEQNQYQMSAEGGILEIDFSTTVSDDNLRILSNATWVNQNIPSRSLTDYRLILNIAPNTNSQNRVASIIFVKEENNEQNILDTVTIVQEGTTGIESTDFSEDGEITVLQEATLGRGIPIVIMGDGFIDTEITDGTYQQVMQRACENLFTEEPIKSLRNYFNVYSITAVSTNNVFGYGYDTAFDCELEGNGTTGISGDETTVRKYVDRVAQAQNIDADKALAVVILNTNEYAGTTYFGYKSTLTQNLIDFAIAYCPVIDNLESESFRQVLVHEAIGHGFAKLEDEYAYQEMGTIPASEIASIRNLQSLGWAQNVDFTTDRSAVRWSDFLSDDRYSSEGLGIYEGACTYIRGAYRPTENSMMNQNTEGFNAPSRKAIYDRIMEDGTGNTPDYEEFVTFDRRTQTLSTRSSSGSATGVPFARPRFVGKAISGL